MWKDSARLGDILMGCREAMEFTKAVTFEQFRNDLKLQRALCMVLEIIGEAARAVSEECKAAHPQIPWRAIVGLRHRIVHEYFRLDLNVIWEIVRKDVPSLLAAVEPLVPPREDA
jgi:uncharacterized protein with HEPN domain